IESYKSALAARISAEKQPDFFFDRSSCAVSPGQETGPFEVSIFAHVVKPGGKQLGFAGLTVNSSYIQKQLLPQIITELRRGVDGGAKDSNLAFGIFDEHGREVYPSQGGEHHYEVKLDFSPVFRKWELGLGYQGTTIEALAQAHFRQSVLL